MKERLLLICILGFGIALSLVAQENIKLSADEAVEMGMNESFELYSERMAIKISGKQARLAIREWLPSVSFTWSSNDIVNYSNTDTHSNNLSAKLSQQVFDGGASIIRNKLAEGQLAIQNEKLSLSELSLKNSLWLSYNQLLIQGLQLKLQKQSHKQAQKQLSIYKMELGHGSVTNIEFLQAKISVKELELEIENSKKSYTDLLFNFKQMLGIPVQLSLELIDTDVSNYSGLDLPLNDNQIASMALQSNIEYKSAILEMYQLRKEHNLSMHTYIPKISLELSAGFAGDEFPLTAPNFSAGLNFSFSDPRLPVTGTLSGGSTGVDTRNRTSSVSVTPFEKVGYSLSLKQSQLKIEEQSRKIEKLKETIPHSAISAYKSYLLKKESIQVNKELLELKRKELAIIELKRMQGEIKRSDFIEAQINLSKQEVGMLENILELIKAEQEFASTVGLTPFELLSISQTEEDFS